MVSATQLRVMVTARNCDAAVKKKATWVATRNYDFFIVVMRNCVAIFPNYGSQCDRTDAPTASQFDRNEAHGESGPLKLAKTH